MMDKILDAVGDVYSALGTGGGWIVQICLIAAAAWPLNVALQRVVRRICDGGKDGPASWKRALASSLSAPLSVFIWVAAVAAVCAVLYERFPLTILKFPLGLQPAVHIAVFGWFLLRLVRRCLTVAVAKHNRLTVSTADVLEKISTIVILAATALLIMPSFGVSINGLLAFGGIGGIVVGLAAKDMLANLFGALMLHFDRPFALGDWVHLPEKGIEGNVEHIGWRQVIVRTFDKRLVFIPNSMFGNLILVNPAKMTHRRIYENVGLRYGDLEKVPAVIADIRASLRQWPGVDPTQGVVVHLEKFGPYSVNLIVSAYTKRTGWEEFLALKEEALLEISRLVAAHGAAMAFPTQTLHIDRTAASA
jgi:MscS family membrane protein